MRRVRKMKWWWFLVFPIGGAAMFALFGLVVMKLWNWLMPAIFGLTAITFWQAIGLFVLARLLFSGFNGGKGRHNKHDRHDLKREKLRRFCREHRDEYMQSRKDWAEKLRGFKRGEESQTPNE